MPPTYGLDIETDTTVDGLDPTVSPVVSIALIGDEVELVLDGDEAVIIGRQGGEEVTADELALKLDTINYEVVTRIGHRVPRVAVAEPEADAAHAAPADDRRPKG